MRRTIPARTWVPVDVWLNSQRALRREEFTREAQPATPPEQADHRAAITRAIHRAHRAGY